MYKYLFLTLLSLTLFALPVRAESDENVERRRPEKAQIQEIRQEARAERQENHSQVAENHANRLEKRFGLYYTRLSGIITRFQARLDLLGDQDKDVAPAQAKLDLASAKLESAKLKGAEAVAAFRAIDPAKFSEQKEEAMAARDLAIAARQLFKDAHTLLKDALKELKLISKPAIQSSESAVENSDN